MLISGLYKTGADSTGGIMNQNINIGIQHESYKPKSRLSKVLKGVKRLLIAGIYASLVVIVVSFAENNTLAFAADHEKAETEKTGLTFEQAKLEYFTGIINDAEIAEYAVKYSEISNIDTSLIVALMKVESNFNPLAINYNRNGSIDRGICQLNNSTFKHFKIADFYNVELNIKTGCDFLRWCIDNADDSIVMALAYYNAGYGNVSRENVGDITLNYINKILGYKKTYDDQIALLMN